MSPATLLGAGLHRVSGLGDTQMVRGMLVDQKEREKQSRGRRGGYRNT
ncbi:MAG: hypothetical protein ABSG86_21410 [Thermoguttaceae bacterium]|jgi:hypothetical protein